MEGPESAFTLVYRVDHTRFRSISLRTATAMTRRLIPRVQGRRQEYSSRQPHSTVCILVPLSYTISRRSPRPADVIRNNVIRRVAGPCILTYDDFDTGANIIEGNFCDASGDNGVQVSAGAVVRNNIIYNSRLDGVNVANNDVQPGKSNRNVKIIGNTVVTAGGSCIGSRGTTGHQFSNNALFCSSGASRSFLSHSLLTPFFSVLSGSASGFWFSNGATSIPSGQTAQTRLLRAADSELGNPTGFDFYPKTGSYIIGNGSAIYIDGPDFNANPRQSPPSLGAYEFTAYSNPGWIITNGFKGTVGAPLATGGAPSSGSGSAPKASGSNTPSGSSSPSSISAAPTASKAPSSPPPAQFNTGAPTGSVSVPSVRAPGASSVGSLVPSAIALVTLVLYVLL